MPYLVDTAARFPFAVGHVSGDITVIKTLSPLHQEATIMYDIRVVPVEAQARMLNSLELPLKKWLHHPLPCSKGHFSLFNPTTSFFSYCFTALIEGVISAIFFLPVIYVCFSLFGRRKAESSIKGQIAYLLSLVVVVARASTFYLDDKTPSSVEWFTLVTSGVVCLGQFIQEGRVLVTPGELLLYWFCMVFTTFSHALDDILVGRPSAPATVTAFIATVVTLVLASYSKKGDFDDVNVFDKITMSFLTPLLETAQKRQITRDDLPPAPVGLNSAATYDRLQTALDKTKPTSKYRLILSLMSILKWDIIALSALDAFCELFVYVRPLILSFFLKSLQDYIAGKGPIFRSFYFAILLGAAPLIVNAMMNIYTLYANLVYIISRSALTGVIYRKSLDLHPKSRDEYDSAKVMNMISVDTDQIDGVATNIPTLISAPTALVLATWQLYIFIGPTMFTSIPVYLIFTIYSTWASKKIYNMMPKLMALRDSRTKATTDAIRNIKSLKLYAWEIPFSNKILNIRDDELHIDSTYLRIFAVMSSLWSCVGDVVAAGIFVAFLYYQKGVLSPDTVFPVLALLSYITVPFMQLPNAITSLGRAISSQHRINDFLLQPEIERKNYSRMPAVNGYNKTSVDAEKVTSSWNGDEDDNVVALENISFKAGNGDLICITGKVGAGKTALLKTIVSEIVVLKGEMTVRGSISYCPQEPWLQNLSIKENILFGKKFEPDFYKATLEACALDVDLAALAEKDETEVGEKGVSLSGGQKARVALARAVYARADIFVLDDVLSAVDEHVSTHLIERLLGKNGLIASKTIILATNNVKVLAHASKIITLENKTVLEEVTVKELLERKEESPTYRIMKEFHVGGNIDDIEVFDRKDHIITGESSGTATPLRPSSIYEGDVDVTKKSNSDEDKDNDSVSLSIFKRYFAAAGPSILFAGLIILLSSVLLMNSISIWLGVISNHNFDNLPDARNYIIIYLILALVAGFSIFYSQYWFMCTVSIRVSRQLHHNMLDAVIDSPMRFFDITPIGKIVNRFTGDINKLDMTLPTMLYYFVRSALNLFVQLGTVIVGSPLVIVVAIPLAFLGNKYRRTYIPASRQLQRMSSASNSPILSHIEESVKGAAVVRAFGCVDQFIKVYESRTDYWIDVNFVSLNIRRWLSWRIQGMTATLNFAAALSMVVLVYYGWLSAGMVGVVMYNASRAGIMVQQIISGWADLEVSGVALDRILEYIDLPTEVKEKPDDIKPADSWPEQGKIRFDNFSTRYLPEGEDVLKKINCSIGAQEKIGIVGRTGSGKSTITLSLFRIIEATAGNIDIDAANTSKMGLKDLRSELSIIPQDSQIFGGTLRENLDPLKLATDERLWEVLSLCSLKTHFENLGTGLDTMLSDGGDNLSRGQTQLICLARALLRNSKILVLDEATASVDVQTDKLVQQTIRAQFKDCTIVTIAHRLNTIMDSDRILVLDAGKVVEFDTPQKLLEDKGAFYRLTQASEENEDKKE